MVKRVLDKDMFGVQFSEESFYTFLGICSLFFFLIFYINKKKAKTIKRELAEWFKATSLKLVKMNSFHGFESHALWTIQHNVYITILQVKV